MKETINGICLKFLIKNYSVKELKESTCIKLCKSQVIRLYLKRRYNNDFQRIFHRWKPARP